VGKERVLAEPSYPKDTQRLEKDKNPWPLISEAAKELSLSDFLCK